MRAQARRASAAVTDLKPVVIEGAEQFSTH